MNRGETYANHESEFEQKSNDDVSYTKLSKSLY